MTLSPELALQFAADLSEEQQVVARCRGKVVVVACPGSGKTRAAAYYVAGLLDELSAPGVGVAVLSFTNNAIGEIKKQLAGLGVSLPLAEPHFIGALDSFLMQHLFLPYGRGVMNSRTDPQIVPPSRQAILDEFLPANARSIGLGPGLPPRTVHLAEIDFRPNGQLDTDVLFRGVPTWALRRFPVSELMAAKLAYACEGLATHSDVVYWCYRMLTRPEFAQIQNSLSAKYRSWVLDEAQDTSELHELLLDMLWSGAGPANALVIGDPDQAIFEWNKARPDYLLRLKQKANQGWQALELSASWRSSQLICNATHRFRNPRLYTQPAEARGPDAALDACPLLLTFPASSYPTLPDAFYRLWNSQPFRFEPNPSLVVVSWSRSIVARMRGLDFQLPLTIIGQQLARCMEMYFRNDVGGAYQELECVLSALLFRRPSIGDEFEWLPASLPRSTWVESVSLLLAAFADMAGSNINIAEFVDGAREVLEGFFVRIGHRPIGRLSSRLRVTSSAEAQANLSDYIVAQPQDARMQISTIHSVKGSTVDGLMLVGGYHELGRESDVSEWLKPPAPLTGLCAEPRRLAYVAMTRPRKLLVVAIPRECSDELILHRDWERAGFQYLTIEDVLGAGARAQVNAR